MNKQYFTVTEWFYWIVRALFGGLSTPPRIIANWATDKLNESYYANTQTNPDKGDV